MFDRETLDNLFTYHPPTPEQIAAYAEIRAAARIFADVLVRHTPQGDYQAVAVLKLHECTMIANASIACHDPRAARTYAHVDMSPLHAELVEVPEAFRQFSQQRMRASDQDETVFLAGPHLETRDPSGEHDP